MVNIRQHLVPNRLAIVAKGTNQRKYITIHETANRSRGANANAHARLQAGGNSRNASWHYQVDDKEIVQSYLDTTRCWHAGRSEYALNSIAIEICVNSDGNYGKALENAAALVAHLRKKHNIPWNRVISHNFITGKNCPTIMLSRKGQWDKFIKATEPGKASNVSTASKPKPAPKPAPKKSSSGGSKYPHVALPVTSSHTTDSHNAWVYLMRHAVNRTDRRLTVNIQRWLRDLGYNVGPDDGVFGARTVRALQTFLRDKGLYKGRIDGQRGPMTIRSEVQYLNQQRKYLV